MNIYTFYIFTNHCNAVEDIEEDDRIGFYLNHLEIELLKLPEQSDWKFVKEVIWNNLSLSIPSNWWTGFSLWEDFFGLLRSGTNLPILTH